MSTSQREKIESTASNFGHKAHEGMAEAGNKAKEAASTIGQKVSDAASNVGQRVGEMASSMGHKAGDAASAVKEKAGEAATYLGKKAEDTTSGVGCGMKSLAGTIRDAAGSEGMLGAAGSAVADTLESGGRYLEHEGLSGMSKDVTNLVRRNPIPALLIAVGVGFLVARATSNRS